MSLLKTWDEMIKEILENGKIVEFGETLLKKRKINRGRYPKATNGLS